MATRKRSKQYHSHRCRMADAKRQATPWRALDADMARAISVNYGGKRPESAEANFLRRLRGTERIVYPAKMLRVIAAERVDAGKRQVEIVRFRMTPYLDDLSRRIGLAEAALADLRAGNLLAGTEQLALAVEGSRDGKCEQIVW